MFDSSTFVLLFPPLFFRSLGVWVVLPIRQGLAGSLGILMLSTLTAFSLFGDAKIVSSNVHQLGYGAYFFEILIGALIAFPAALLVSSSAMLGELFDIGRGQQIGAQYDPMTGSQQSGMAIVSRSYTWAIILAAGLLPRLFSVLVASFHSLPPGEATSVSLETLAQSLLVLLAPYLTGLFVAFIPFVLLFLIVSVGMGYLSRIAPQMQLHGEVFLFKTLLGIGLIVVLLEWDLAAVLIRLCEFPEGILKGASTLSD